MRLDRGKQRRLGRLFAPDGKVVIVPTDDGLIDGPVGGLRDINDKISSICVGGADGILGFKGVLGQALEVIPSTCGLIMNVTGSTTLGIQNDKRLVSSVEAAVRLGADAVAVHVNLGSSLEPHMLETLGKVSDACDTYGMPLLGIIYPRGGNIVDEHRMLAIRHAARLGAEMGCDVVKTFYTGDAETFAEVTAGCPVPVLTAGGPVKDLAAYFESVKGALAAGARGIVCGRNVFHRINSDAVVKYLSYLVHGGEEPAYPDDTLYPGVDSVMAGTLAY